MMVKKKANIFSAIGAVIARFQRQRGECLSASVIGSVSKSSVGTLREHADSFFCGRHWDVGKQAAYASGFEKSDTIREKQVFFREGGGENSWLPYSNQYFTANDKIIPNTVCFLEGEQ